MFRQAQSQAGGFLNFYSNLDLLKPYFDVELPAVIRRIKLSLLPWRPQELLTSGTPPDLYGPTMLVFTLVAVLLVGMKLSHQSVREGTLIGSAFGLCFSYWVVASLGVRLTAYLVTMTLSLLEALSLVGYALSGYCLGLITHYLLYPISPTLSITGLVAFGGASAASLAVVFWSNLRYHGKNKAFVAGCVGGVHFLFLLYIRFFYASLYDAAAAAF